MKVADLVNVADDYQLVRIWREQEYNACVNENGEDVDCTYCGYDCLDNIKKETRICNIDMFYGESIETPLRLGQSTIKSIRIEQKGNRGRAKNTFVLAVEVK